MQWTQETAEKRLEALKVPNMPLVAIRPQGTAVAQDWFQKYKELCYEFMRSLTDSVQELALMNLSREEFMELIMGRKLPVNLSIRFRTPLIWGGKLDIDNLFICLTFPVSQNLDRFIIEQSGNDTIWLPNPQKKIYLPIHSTISGNGGNATADRLAQIGATMNTGRR